MEMSSINMTEINSHEESQTFQIIWISKFYWFIQLFCHLIDIWCDFIADLKWIVVGIHEENWVDKMMNKKIDLLNLFLKCFDNFRLSWGMWNKSLYLYSHGFDLSCLKYNFKSYKELLRWNISAEYIYNVLNWAE